MGSGFRDQSLRLKVKGLRFVAKRRAHLDEGLVLAPLVCAAVRAQPRGYVDLTPHLHRRRGGRRARASTSWGLGLGAVSGVRGLGFWCRGSGFGVGG